MNRWDTARHLGQTVYTQPVGEMVPMTEDEVQADLISRGLIKAPYVPSVEESIMTLPDAENIVPTDFIILESDTAKEITQEPPQAIKTVQPAFVHPMLKYGMLK